jgi:hypothetical protein
VGTAGKNEQIDDDILESRAEVLRARDIIPPYQPGRPGEAREERASSGGPDEVSAQRDKPPAEDIGEAPSKSTSGEHEKREIPRLDLAEEIMAEQRRITAIRRKAPGEGQGGAAVEPGAEPGAGSGVQFRPAQSEEERVVAEIVARDIEKLYGGGVQGDNR